MQTKYSSWNNIHKIRLHVNYAHKQVYATCIRTKSGKISVEKGDGLIISRGRIIRHNNRLTYLKASVLLLS